MNQDLADAIEDALGTPPRTMTAMGGGCVAEVRAIELRDGREIVAKLDRPDRGNLDLEARMLRYLAEKSELPVPEVHFATPGLLLMEKLEGRTGCPPPSWEHAAALLAGLHSVRGEQFGFAEDTLIGGLPQPNPLNDSWIDFFREARLLSMARSGLDSGRLPSVVLDRIEKLCGKLEDLIPSDGRPSLIHGDCWGGNVLAQGEQITGFIDPAIYFADPEIELAFSTLFGTFGDSFFEAYADRLPIRPGFFEERRELYNLYPLLVHVRLFGGSYVSRIVGTLDRFGV